MIDTESTGTKDSQVCQLAYLDFSSGKAEAGNFYFAVDDMSEYAREVHGLSIAMLWGLSKGLRFADHSGKINELIAGKRVAGHSVQCDMLALKAEFNRCGYACPSVKQFCTMAHFRPILNIYVEGQRKPKAPSLTELCTYLGVRVKTVSDLAQTLYGASTRQHDARYDVCATYLCVQKAEQAGMVRGLLPQGG